MQPALASEAEAEGRSGASPENSLAFLINREVPSW